VSVAAKSQAPDFGAAMTAWADSTPAVSGLVLIGSRVRPPAEKLEVADTYSDWDFHVITADVAMFRNRQWTTELVGGPASAYAARSAAIGGVPKVNLILPGVEADLVIIPQQILRTLKFRVAFGRHRRAGWSQSRMQDIAEVIRPGWRFLKGAERWGDLYRRAVAEVVDPRLGDVAARQLAEGFVCDYIWTLRKMDRGEYRTAQRMLHRELAEVNFQLLHELKLRRGERTFTKARRIERTAQAAELAAVTVDTGLDPGSLRSAIEKSAATCRELMAALVGGSWRWPL
jgi:hypothetical protein